MRIKSGILQKCESWYKKNDDLKDFKKQLKLLKDDFSRIFPHLHMKDNHCSPWSTYSLQLLDDLKITPKVYINLDLKEGNQHQDLDKWLRAVGSDEEIERIEKINGRAINSNHKIYGLADEIQLDQLVQPLITQELISYNILEQKRSKL